MKLFNSKSLLLSLTVLLMGSMLFTACQPDDTDPIPTTFTETLEANSLTTFAEALEAANLTTQLNGTAITVFAPSNAAFDTYLSANGHDDVNDVPIGELKNLLLNHVVDGYLYYDDLANGYVKTLAKSLSDEFFVDMKIDTDLNLLNNSATVTNIDLDGLTGVIHVVDRVITVPDVMDFVNFDGNLNSLRDALSFVQLTSLLQEEGPFTMFAPIDGALEWGTSMSIDNMDFWEETLSDHIADGNIGVADFTNDMLIQTRGADAESSFRILTETFDNTIQIVEADDPTSIITRIEMTEIQGSNGVIHVIPKVIVL